MSLGLPDSLGVDFARRDSQRNGYSRTCVQKIHFARATKDQFYEYYEARDRCILQIDDDFRS
jgi:hypothetical protein